MCSPDILFNLSCYTDNFPLIGEMLVKGSSLGVVFGITVGVLLIFAKKLNS